MTKRCARCGLVKSVAEFAVRSDRGNAPQSYCRPCTKEYQREWHQRHGERRRRETAVVRDKRRQQARDYVNKIKDVPCADCGKKYPPHMMDFDHVRGRKSGNVSAMVNSALALWRIRAEIAKCEVVCANCHRIRTFRRRRDAASEERGIYGVPPERVELSTHGLRIRCSAN